MPFYFFMEVTALEKLAKIALVGNPNCGKSTLFNLLTGKKEYVGNRPGVTVTAKEGLLKNYTDIIIADTPGVYSLSPFSPDEAATGAYLLEEKPDVIINLADSRNLRRSLYLTTQVLETGIPVIILLNFFDKKEAVDTEALAAMLGADVLCINAKSGENVSLAVQRAVSLIGSGKAPHKLFETKSNEPQAEAFARYSFVDEVISFCNADNESRNQLSRKIDKIVLNKFLAFPIFFALLFLVYYFSVSLIGSGISSLIEQAFAQDFSPFVINLLKGINCSPVLISLIENAVLTAVFTVLSFLPQIFMLFFSLTLLEESGYMARAAFITDAAFKDSALSGKSLISFLVGGACSVTGIMSARTIESKKSRSLTALLTPFVPCSAKVTVIALIARNNFSNSRLSIVFAFLLSFFAIALSAKLLKHHRYFAEKSSFLLEMPPYSLPSPLFAAKRATEQSFGFLKKAVNIILISSVLLWALSFFGFSGKGISQASSFEKSFLGFFGSAIAPVFAPLGFGNAGCACAVLSGLFAKENIIGTLSMFPFQFVQMNTADAISFLAFNLFCPPCIVAIGTMKKELGSIRLTAFALLYQTVFAFGLAFVLHLILNNIFSL